MENEFSQIDVSQALSQLPQTIQEFCQTLHDVLLRAAQTFFEVLDTCLMQPLRRALNSPGVQRALRILVKIANEHKLLRLARRHRRSTKRANIYSKKQQIAGRYE